MVPLQQACAFQPCGTSPNPGDSPPGEPSAERTQSPRMGDDRVPYSADAGVEPFGSFAVGLVARKGVAVMDELDELGPVDYLVVEFPPDTANFTGEMAAELAALAEAGTIRILDVLILQKADDGSIEALEIDDLDAVEELVALEAEIAEILAADDVAMLAEAMENGTTAGVIVWENTWAAPFASAARRAGGQLIASGRIPIQAIIASLEADEASMTEGD
jgi:hypothetical protein